ncbi:uncharacterized protein LOC128384081 [Scomber japonicus]|uniref:uncharacterized protein LOC128384081 n=1 Tax=Scomber japonicus TaxID=13676 RepID=UPI002305C074|nr:uncharacterized protein LOC128384081 [Scomber japonicus]
MYTFEKSCKLRAKKKVTIWVPDFGIHSPPSDLIWMDLKRWTKGDKLLVELINCDEEIVKTTETQDANKQKDTNLAGKNSTELRVNVEIDPDGKYLCLNESREDLKLEDWKLRVKVNDQNPIMFTFKESFTLKANRSVTIWAHGCDPYYPGPSELAWNELKRWAKGDKLFVELINCHEEIVKTTEAQGTSTHRDTNLAGENSTEVRVNVEIDPDGKYLCLNESREEVLLEGWRLRVKVNDEDPIMFTFKESFTIKANRSVTIWAHGCDPYYPGPSELAWNELKSWAREDKLFVELINCHGEIVKTTEAQGRSKHKDNNVAGKNSTEVRVNVEIDPDGKYLYLNESREDLLLEDWRLRVKVNNENPIMFTFKESFTLRANRSVTIWAHGCDPYYPGPSELAWNELKCWAKGDKLFVELINCHEEIITTTETQGRSKQKDTNLAGKNSTELQVNVEIDPDGKYLCLNESKEIWANGWGTYSPPSDLIWKDLQCWDKGDKLFVELINCHEEIVKTTEV